jgi:hypothetical protein
MTAPRGADALLALIEQYDCSSLEVTEVRFADKAGGHPGGTTIAYWEADPLVITGAGEVVAFDHADPSFVICPCAASGSMFLDGLAVVVEAISDKGQWRDRWQELVERAAERAGGSKYRKFFEVVSSPLLRASGVGP